MDGPLAGIKVLEFTEVIAAPLAGMLLSDMGADVTKIEPPWGDPWRSTQPCSDTESRPFIAYNRGKKDITLDLTTDVARQVLEKLVPTVDVILVNYRPDVAANLGVDYQTLYDLNPTIIYCEVTAFGREGEDADRPGYDLIIQGMSGLMNAEAKTINGTPQHISSSPLIDTTAGFSIAWLVSSALYAREKTGKGQKIETTLLGTALALMGMRYVQIEELDAANRRETLNTLDALRTANSSFEDIKDIYDSEHPQVPGHIYYRAYTTGNGAITVGCLSDVLRKKLLEVLNLEDIRFSEDYDPLSSEAIRFGNDLVSRTERIFLTKSSEEWLDILSGSGIPAGPVRYVEEVFDDPQVKANNLTVDLQHQDLGVVRMVGPLATFSETPMRTLPLSALGQHTDETLLELGYPQVQIDVWRADGIIR